MKKIWFAVQDKYAHPDEGISNWTISKRSDREGWNTDSGYEGNGLPRKLAEWICERLNEVEDDSGFSMNKIGEWKEE